MQVNIKEYLTKFITENRIFDDLNNILLPDVNLDTEKIKVIMINETTPQNPDDYFYSISKEPDYMKTTLPLFLNAGADVNSIQDILDMGIYITTAVKSPKTEYSVETSAIKTHMPVLECEINLFPDLQVIMLMGDTAKKAFNMITKKNINRNTIPSESTYKIRKNEYYYNSIRVFPSYIMTGGNILIEKSKAAMVTEDIKIMLEIIKK